MREFKKGALITVVDDDDRRIPEYLASGWKETTLTEKPKDDADKRKEKAMDDVNKSEGKSNGKKTTASDKKINDAIKANETAATESEEVDDGLIKKGQNMEA